MAVLMVYDRDNTHPDPAKDAAGCYKRGYIVQVFEDSQPLVIPPAEPFLFVILRGVPADDFATWGTEPEIDADGNITRRRAYSIDLDSLAKDKNCTVRDRCYEVA